MTWKEITRLRNKFERLHKRKIYDALMDQLREVLKEINPGVLDMLDQKIPTIVSNNSVKKAFYNLYNDVGWTFYRANRFKKSLDDVTERSLWDMTFEKVIEAATGERITLITDYSKEILMQTAKEVLRQGQLDGLGILEMERIMRKTLSSEFQRMARYRSLRIVQTEVMTAANFATNKAGHESGLNMRKRWLTAPVGIAKTERHNEYQPGLGNQRPKDGQPFNVGGVMMQYPGDGPPEQVINCRCSLSWEPIERDLDLI